MVTAMTKPRLVLSFVALLAAPAVNAQADTSGWACEFCPFEQGHRTEYSVGATAVSEDSAYVGDATGYDEEGAYGNLDANGSYANDGYRMRWYAEDLALDSRALELDAGRLGSYDYSLGYREVPRRTFNTTRSVFGLSGETLSLPSGWVRSGTTSGLTQLNSNLASRNIESDRSIFDVGGRYLPSDRWSISADYRRHDRDGLKIHGGSNFTNAALLPMPFDYVTDEVDLGIRFESDSGFVALGWYLSDFENQNASLTWEQPFTVSAATGNDFPTMAQAPDSRFQQLSVTAGYAWPEQNTVISLSAATGEIEQDSAFLPYTSSSGISADPLPRASLDGQVDTSNLALAITSRFIDKLRVKFSYRYDERDNKTSQAQWNRVIVDTFVSNELETNLPYSFERSNLSLSGDYDLFDTVRISAGYDRKDIDRDFQEVAEQTEDSAWGRVRWRPTQLLEVDIRGGGSRRDIGSYNETFAATLGQNPLLRKYNLAYRYREFGELSVALSPADLPVSLTVTGLFADDSYTRSQLGMLSADEFRLTADFGWTVSENASAYVNVGVEDIESLQAGSEAFAAADWQATHDDDFTTIGAGFHVRNIGEQDNFDLRLDYLRSDGASEIIVDSAVGGPSEFPELKSELDYARLRLAYRRSERLEINLDLTYQRFLAEDWTLEGVGPATMPSVLSLGAHPYSPEVILFGIGFRYRAGGE